MKVQLNSDKNIAVDRRVNQFVREEVKRAIGRFSGKLTRIEIHLSDVNGRSKAGTPDKRCMVEARPAGHRPMAVTMVARNMRSAVQGSLSKLRNALETFFGRAGRYRTRTERQGIQSPSPRTRGKRVVTPRPAKRTEGTVTSRNGSAATASKAVQRAPGHPAAAWSTNGNLRASTGRGPKKKAIYQARRKSWPKR